MEEKKVEIGDPIIVRGVTLVPVIEQSLNYWYGKNPVSFFGVKQPVAIIVVSASGKRAYRASGEEVSLAQLIQEIPGIGELLEVNHDAPR